MLNKKTGIEPSSQMVCYTYTKYKHLKFAVMEKYLIHSNELHLIDKKKIHHAVKQMVASLDLAAGSTYDFNLYKVVEAYFTDLERREKINRMLEITDSAYELHKELGES